MSIRASFRERQRENEHRMCKAKGCNLHRAGMSGWCSTHQHRVVHFGHTDGKRWFPKEFEKERLKVKALLQVNPDHPGIKQGVKFFQDWIEKACTLGHQFAQKQMLRLQDEGITGEMLLVECASIWLFSHLTPWALPTELPLTYALGITMLTLSTVYKVGCTSVRDVPPKLRREVGQYIRSSIGLLLMNIYKTVERADSEAEDRRKAMAEPLVPHIVIQKAEGEPPEVRPL